MSIQRLPSGRLRVQVYDPSAERRCPPCAKRLDDECERCGGSGIIRGANVSITRVLTVAELEQLGAVNGTFRANERKKAKRARERAREKLGERRSAITVWEFWQRWTTDAIYTRPKPGTNAHNKERTSHFARKFRDLPMADVGDEIVAGWLAGGKRNAQVPALRAMWRDAMSPKAGRLVTSNPWAGLGLERSKGNAGKQPPSIEDMWHMLKWARRITPPSFADWLEFGCYTGLRCGEIDALRPQALDWEAEEIDVAWQWNVKARAFTTPKYGPYRAGLCDDAKEVARRALARRDSESEFLFSTLRGSHYTPSARTHHWNRVRAKVGFDQRGITLYLATRHFFGWYAINVLELDPAIVAVQFGHKDGGRLVEQLYGHRDARAARRKLVERSRRVERPRVYVVGREALAA